MRLLIPFLSILFFSFSLFSQNKKLSVPLSSQISEFRVQDRLLKPVISKTIPLEGIPTDLDTFSLWALDLSQSQSSYELLKAGELSKEEFDSKKFPKGSYLDQKLRHSIYALSGLKNDKKIIIIDTNNNGDLSDERYFEFDTSLAFDQKMEAVSPLLMLNFEFAQDGKIIKDQIIGKFEPFEFQRDSSYYKNNILYLGFELYEWYSGTLEVEGKKFNIRVEGTLNRPNRNSYVFIWPYGESFDKALRYAYDYNIYLNDHKIRIIENDLAGKEMVFEDLGEVKEREKIGGFPGLYAPQIHQEDINGNDFNLHEQGDYILMHFWATWCAPCMAQHPKLVELHKKYDSKAQFVGIAADANISMTKEHVEKASLDWIHIYTPFNQVLAKGSIASNYWVHSWPTYLIISPEGKIVARTIGIDHLEKELANIFPDK